MQYLTPVLQGDTVIEINILPILENLQKLNNPQIFKFSYTTQKHIFIQSLVSCLPTE